MRSAMEPYSMNERHFTFILNVLYAVRSLLVVFLIIGQFGINIQT